MNKTCRHCRFWKIDPRWDRELLPVAKCVRHAPEVKGWPTTRREDWCGDFEWCEELDNKSE